MVGSEVPFPASSIAFSKISLRAATTGPASARWTDTPSNTSGPSADAGHDLGGTAFASVWAEAQYLMAGFCSFLGHRPSEKFKNDSMAEERAWRAARRHLSSRCWEQ